MEFRHATDFSKVKNRDALKPRREPYWSKISQGNCLGFRKLNNDSKGTWLARAYDNHTTKKPQKSLGDFLACPDNLRFEMAHKSAQEWFTHLGPGGSTQEVTIQNVCDNYVDYLKQKGNERASVDASKRFKAYVLDDSLFAHTPLGKITPKHIQTWQNKLRDEPTKAGANKGKSAPTLVLTGTSPLFRAALNLAQDQRHVTDDFAWSKELRPLKDADKSRVIYLTEDERNAIISNAPADLAQLIKIATLILLRPDALANLTTVDYNKRPRTPFIPKDKANAKRTIPLGNQLFDFLE